MFGRHFAFIPVLAEFVISEYKIFKFWTNISDKQCKRRNYFPAFIQGDNSLINLREICLQAQISYQDFRAGLTGGRWLTN
uniref:Uncharacterized protein n=1 Tax=uncultured Desulfobacterium sp. TaxID=201089 RepID=E1YGY0_9BACT|nr:unknown protein [uncultured Desulfobacterium sp.]